MSEEKKMNVYEKLQKVQENLKAPKNRTNSFGKYSYRNCEDILESCKPLLAEYKAVIVLSDYIEKVDDRYYVKAVASFIDTETGEKIENQAFARESAEKRGMDDSQITGTASSYSRKYALNGLLAIDDEKDADSDEYAEEQRARATRSKKSADTPNEPQGISDSDKRELVDLVEGIKEKYPNKNFSFDSFFPNGVDGFTVREFAGAKAKLMGLLNKKAANNG